MREALSSLQRVRLVKPKVGDGNYECGSIETMEKHFVASEEVFLGRVVV